MKKTFFFLAMIFDKSGIYIPPSNGTSGLNVTNQGVFAGPTYDLEGRMITSGMSIDSRGIDFGPSPGTKGMIITSHQGKLEQKHVKRFQKKKQHVILTKHSAETKEIQFFKTIQLLDPSESFIHTGSIRTSPLGNGWYVHGDAQELKLTIQKLYQEASQRFGPFAKHVQNPKILLSPHAGLKYSGACAAAAYSQLKADGKIQRVVVLSPQHTQSKSVSGLAFSHFHFFETPFGKTRVDQDTLKKWVEIDASLFQFQENVHAKEHAIEMQLIFLQERLGLNFQLLPIIVGEMTESQVSQVAQQLTQFFKEKEQETLLVISTDWTHYGRSYDYTPFKTQSKQRLLKEIKQLDSRAIDIVTDASQTDRSLQFRQWLELTRDTICGKWPLLLFLELFSQGTWKNLQPASLLAYDTSSHVSQDDSSDQVDEDVFSNVSYASILWFENEGTASHTIESDSHTGPVSSIDHSEKSSFVQQQDSLWTSFEKVQVIKTVRSVIFNHLKPRLQRMDETFFYPILSPAFQQKLGVFVTLNLNGQLRGCRGVIETHLPIAISLVQQTIATAFHDSRFDPVSKLEAKELEIEVTILSPLRQVKDYKTEIIVGLHGVTIDDKNGHGAVFLPQVPVEKGRHWTLIEYLNELARKAGMNPLTGISFHSSKVNIHEPEFDFSSCVFHTFEGYTIGGAALPL